MYNILKFSNGATIYQYAGKVRRHVDQISDEDMVEIAKDFLSRLQDAAALLKEQDDLIEDAHFKGYCEGYDARTMEQNEDLI